MNQKSDNWDRFISKAKAAGYCKILELRIVDGKPDLSEPVNVDYGIHLKPGSVSNAKREADHPEARSQWQRLIDYCRSEGTCVIKELTIQDGLPFRYVISKEELI